jgi:methylated-DNA-[protein]-cysteine S-methyltransferase
MNELRYTVFNTKFGWIGATASRHGITQTTLPMLSVNDCMNKINSEHKCLNYSPGFFVKFSEKVIRYFDGEKVLFDEKLDYSNSSQFSQAVWTISRSIPCGQTRTYKQIASKIDRPNAFRAVARVMANNQFPLIVPCHRVISVGGRSNGFGGKNGLDLYTPDLRLLLLNLESNKS